MNAPTILVVDDNPDHLELSVMALSDCCDPNGIVTAEDGIEALDYLFGRGKYEGRDVRMQPHFILLDMKLMRLHGLDVLKAVRKDPGTANIPVVMHSSSTEKSDVAACYANGANSYVRKATDFGDLSRKMQHVYKYWVNVNERLAPASA